MRIIRAKDVPVNLNTLLSLLDFGIDDEPTLAEKKVAYMGEPVVAVIATTEKLALDAVAKRSMCNMKLLTLFLMLRRQ